MGLIYLLLAHNMAFVRSVPCKLFGGGFFHRPKALFCVSNLLRGWDEIASGVVVVDQYRPLFAGAVGARARPQAVCRSRWAWLRSRHAKPHRHRSVWQRWQAVAVAEGGGRLSSAARLVSEAAERRQTRPQRGAEASCLGMRVLVLDTHTHVHILDFLCIATNVLLPMTRARAADALN